MAKKKVDIDLNRAFADLQSQFQGLDPKEPGQWPLVPQVAAYLAAAAAVVALGWFLVLKGVDEELENVRSQEIQLKGQYREKLTQAINLPELRKQKLQVQEYVLQMERQLPSKAEMDALLSDITQAGLGRGLQFEFFRPGSVTVKDYYAELPIAIRVTGTYHDVGAFAADIANLSRIVTLHGLSISSADSGNRAKGSGTLAMEGTAFTYRYLDPSEIAAQRKSAPGAAQ